MLYTVIFIPAQAPSPDIGKQFVDFALGEEAQLMMEKKHFTNSPQRNARAGDGHGSQTAQRRDADRQPPEDLDTSSWLSRRPSRRNTPTCSSERDDNAG